MKISYFMHSKKNQSLFILLFSLLILGGCATDDLPKSASAAAAFQEAKDLEKDERYEEAIEKYLEVKNKHPYSKYAIEAELKMADIHYKREAYEESQAAYSLFKEFHPKHPKSDYVTFRLAMSYFHQLPSSIDRDLSLAHKALLSFDEIITSHHSSKHYKEALEKKKATLKMLAGKEHYIADFYFSREKYPSALNRFQRLLKKYPGLGFDAKALMGASISALKSGDQDVAVKLFSELKSRFPLSAEMKEAQKVFKNNGIH